MTPGDPSNELKTDPQERPRKGQKILELIFPDRPQLNKKCRENHPKQQHEYSEKSLRHKKPQISEAASLPAFVPGLQDHGTFEITAERHEQLHVIPTESYEHRDFVEARRNFRMVFQPQPWLGIFPGWAHNTKIKIRFFLYWMRALVTRPAGAPNLLGRRRQHKTVGWL